MCVFSEKLSREKGVRNTESGILNSILKDLVLRIDSLNSTPHHLLSLDLRISGAMAVSVKVMASIVSVFGGLSFILGVVAENKKPASGTPVPGKTGVTCKFPADPTVALGYLSVAFLVASTVAGYLSLFYPYKGKSVPQGILFKSPSFVVFFNIALFTTGLAATMLLWPTITEQVHLTRNLHLDPNYACPTAKTGLLGGGAFLSLDSSLFWLIALMLADNAREDFFDEDGDEGEKVLSDAYDADVGVNGSA